MAFALAGIPPAISNGDVILIVVLIAIPVAAIAFIAGSGSAFRQIGRGAYSVEFESDAPSELRDSGGEAASAELRDEEIRQLLEAKAYRQSARGETPVDVDAEFERLMAEQAATPPSADTGLREEVRQLVVARNERRLRQGKEPLDVEEEVQRQLRDLGSLEG